MNKFICYRMHKGVHRIKLCFKCVQSADGTLLLIYITKFFSLELVSVARECQFMNSKYCSEFISPIIFYRPKTLPF